MPMSILDEANWLKQDSLAKKIEHFSYFQFCVSVSVHCSQGISFQETTATDMSFTLV